MTNRKPRRPAQAAFYPPQPPPYAVPLVQAPAPSVPPMANRVVSAQVLQDKNASVANVTLSKFTDWSKGPDYNYQASGSAKREQGDVYDAETGELLALARAFQRLARQLQSEGNRRVQAMVKQQAQARDEAERRAAEPKREVHRRTKEEWEAMKHTAAQETDEEAGQVIPELAALLKQHGSSNSGVISGNTLSMGLRIGLTDERFIDEEDGYLVLHEPGKKPLRLTHA